VRCKQVKAISGEVLYNGGEPRTFSYAEITGRVKIGIIFYGE